jgi:hypothetical protein
MSVGGTTVLHRLVDGLKKEPADNLRSHPRLVGLDEGTLNVGKNGEVLYALKEAQIVIEQWRKALQYRPAPQRSRLTATNRQRQKQ